jgi:hypothetical protein
VNDKHLRTTTTVGIARLWLVPSFTAAYGQSRRDGVIVFMTLYAFVPAAGNEAGVSGAIHDFSNRCDVIVVADLTL